MELAEIDRSRTAKRGSSVRGWIRENRTYAAILISIIVVLAVTLTVLTVIYTKHLDTMVEKESQGYLEEISTQMNTSLVKEMTHNYSVLESLATKLEQTQNLPAETILADLTHEAKIFDYQQIALIDQDGLWITERGTYTIPAIFPYVTQMQSTGTPVTTSILALFDEDCVVFFHPLENTVIGGREYIGVAAMADMDMLNSMLSLSIFDGAGYSHVVTSQGNTVIRSTHETNQFYGYNLFKYLESASFYDGVTVDTLCEDFQEGHTRKIHYEIAGQDLLSIYVPVKYGDWYLFTVIPSDILTEKTNSFYWLTVLACAAISVLFLALTTTISLILVQGRQKLRNQLYTDPVTGGLSKVKFLLDAESILLGGKPYSMIYANIRKFKMVNERDGDKTGDRLLAGIDQAIGQSLGEGERVCRLMADHFGILVAEQDQDAIQKRIQMWDEEIQAQVSELNISTAISACYGVLPVADPAEAVVLLVDKANMARKMAGAGQTIAFYDDTLSERLHYETQLESRQEQALENEEFMVYFQPKYDPGTERIAGAEALVRWISPDQGMIMPDKFIPLFESNGFIYKLDLYVFERTCRFIRRVQEGGLGPLPVSVNLSRLNLNHTDFIQDYVWIWQQYQIPASLLEFEITETLVYENMEQLNLLLGRLHQAGFRVSMDDFGNGYSSLNMLKSVDFDVLKLDRDFFRQKPSESNRALLIVKRLIGLAKDLGMQVVAEGVETRDVVDFLREEDCDMIQGYYYSKPIPEAEMWNRLKEENEI